MDIWRIFYTFYVILSLSLSLSSTDYVQSYIATKQILIRMSSAFRKQHQQIKECFERLWIAISHSLPFYHADILI